MTVPGYWFSACPDNDYCFWAGPRGTGGLKLTTGSEYCPSDHLHGMGAFLVPSSYGMTQVESVDGENSMGIQGWDLTHHQTYSMAEYGLFPSLDPSESASVTICPYPYYPYAPKS